MSGGYWATVREDGVAMFDGRMTIKTEGRLPRGRRHLWGRGFPKIAAAKLDQRKHVYNNWISGTLAASTIPMSLGLHFEAASSEKSWAKDSLQTAAAAFKRYERLVRGSSLPWAT